MLTWLVVAGWAVSLALLWLRSRSHTTSLLTDLMEVGALAEGYKQAALFNKQAAEDLDEQVTSLTYELSLLRSAVFTLPGEGSDEPGSLDLRA